MARDMSVERPACENLRRRCTAVVADLNGIQPAYNRLLHENAQLQSRCEELQRCLVATSSESDAGQARKVQIVQGNTDALESKIRSREEQLHLRTDDLKAARKDADDAQKQHKDKNDEDDGKEQTLSDPRKNIQVTRDERDKAEE
jgi:regulator of replication initiation timing